jgi:flagellar basal-body rod modification protein FlgD
MITTTSGVNYLQPNMVAEASPTNDAPKDSLGRNEFLTLLIAQLKNQDPLNPMEGQEFASQLAQFSSLEQLFDVNENLTGIKGSLQSTEGDQALDYIGKIIKAKDNAISKSGDQVDACAYSIEERANVMISIFNDKGIEVRSVYTGWEDPGEHGFDWDGRNNAGVLEVDGNYTFEVRAVDESGLPVSATTYMTGEVTGVSYQGGITYLMMGDRLVTPDKAIEVRKNINS